MTARASIIVWSAGSGVLLGLFIDIAILGIWTLVSHAAPLMSPKQLPRWVGAIVVIALAIVPVATGILGYLEGRLKID